MGLGICYIGALRNNPRQVIELFELPRLVFPVCGMTVGWPAKQPMIRPRLPLEAVLHWDRYDPDDREYIREYDRAMVETGIYDGRQVSGETMEPKEYGWAEHSARRVSRPARPYLKAVLEEMGFLTEES
jgi:FMN reductase (NADPH)